MLPTFCCHPIHTLTQRKLSHLKGGQLSLHWCTSKVHFPACITSPLPTPSKRQWTPGWLPPPSTSSALSRWVKSASTLCVGTEQSQSHTLHTLRSPDNEPCTCPSGSHTPHVLKSSPHNALYTCSGALWMVHSTHAQEHLGSHSTHAHEHPENTFCTRSEAPRVKYSVHTQLSGQHALHMLRSS